MNLPGYLKPEGGIFRIDDAETLWGLVHYGIAVGTPDTPEVKRLRQRARQEVATVASRDPGPIRYVSTPIQRRPWEQAWDAQFPSGGPVGTRSAGCLIFPRTWVTVAAMAGLFRQHGHPYPWEQEAEPAGLPPSPTSNIAKPGPKQSPGMTSAIQEALALVDSGKPKKSAAMDVGEKYDVKSGSVLRAIQRKRNSP